MRLKSSLVKHVFKSCRRVEGYIFSFCSDAKAYQRPVTSVRTFFYNLVVIGKHLSVYLKYFRIYKSVWMDKSQWPFLMSSLCQPLHNWEMMSFDVFSI